jgi:inosine/xanthosine triphosphate pyrophosphatase family protein
MFLTQYLFENNIILVSSNEDKLNEFKRLGLKNIKIEKGRDLKEVDADDITVITYKAKDAGKNRLVEDTSLNIEGETVGVNIRWMLNNLKKFENKKAEWVVLLGLNTGKEIKIFKGKIDGIIVNPNIIPQNAFGFDPYFVPLKNNPNKFTLTELENKGFKDKYSARKLAIDNFIKNSSIKIINVKDIPKWTGKYQ